MDGADEATLDESDEDQEHTLPEGQLSSSPYDRSSSLTRSSTSSSQSQVSCRRPLHDMLCQMAVLSMVTLAPAWSHTR